MDDITCEEALRLYGHPTSDRYGIIDDDCRRPKYEVKDSGERKSFSSGMVRDTETGKVQYDRVLEGPMLYRWAEHLTKGAVKYPDLPDGSANWTLADGNEEMRRFRRSAFRHFIQWLRGDRDEDHAAALFFNVNGAEYVYENQKARAADA